MILITVLLHLYGRIFFKRRCEEEFGGNEVSFQFDLAAAEKLPKLSKEESRALREGYEKDVALLQRDDASFIPVLPIDEQGRLKRDN